MSRNKKIMIGVGVVLVLGAIAFANFKFKRTEGISVTTEPVKKRHLEAIVSASGKIQPKRDVNISADTMGRVTDLAVDEGDRVTKGQFLLQIDPRNLRTAVQRTEASVAAGRSQVDQLQTSIESSKVALKQAQDNYTRQQNLWKGGLTTRETLERSESDLRLREADLQAQEQQLRTQQLRIESESATAASARFDLSKVRIESPITGIVTRRNIEEGETVVIGTMNNAGTVLLTIADMSIIQAEVDVDETDIPSVRFGQTAKVTIDAMPGQTFTGKVTEIGNSPIQAAGASAADAGDELQGRRHARQGNRRTCGRASRAPPRSRPRCATTCVESRSRRRRSAKSSSTTRATSSGRRTEEKQRRRPPAGAVQAAELKPGQSRKELEGVFVVQDRQGGVRRRSRRASPGTSTSRSCRE